MFCQNCGTENPNDGVFCQNCGTKLEKPETTQSTEAQASPQQQAPQAQYQQSYAQPGSQMSTQPRKPIPKAAIIAGVAVLAFILVITIAFNVLKSLANPERIVESYAKAYISHDAKALYNSLDFPESKFITVEKFEKSLTNDKTKHFTDCTDYTIEETPATRAARLITDKAEREKALSTLHYVITFRDESNAFEYKVNIELDKLTKKKFLFFDNWKVKTSAFLAKDIGISVPVGSSVVLDDVVLDDSYTKVTEGEGANTRDLYTVPYMFSGEYNLKVSVPQFKDMEKSFKLGNSDYSSNHVVSINPDELEISDEVIDDLSKKAKGYIEAVYKAALNKKPLTDAIPENEMDSAKKDQMINNFKNFVEYNIKRDTHLKSVQFTEITPEFQNKNNYTSDECSLGVQFNVDTRYNTTSIVKSFWNNKKETKKTDDGSSTFSFTFHYNGENWVLYDTSCVNSYSCVDYQRY